MSTSILTLIALWCGNPVSPTWKDVSYRLIGPEVTVQDVQQCREKLIQCVNEPPVTDYDKAHPRNCFSLTPYPGKDY